MSNAPRIVPAPVEAYLASLNRSGDSVLDAIAREAGERSLPAVDAETGALLHVLARTVGSRRILEIGTANGYSGVWLARALPTDGMLFTCEIDAERAAWAKANFQRAGVADRTSILVGDVSRLVAKVAGPFDLVFQDGAKSLYEPLLD